MPHTKRNNYKAKWLAVQSQLNQSTLKVASERVTTASSKINNLDISRAVLESTTLLLEKEFIESIEMMTEYADMTEIKFDNIKYSPGGSMGNKIKTACGVIAIMRERLGIIYEAFIDLSKTADESRAAMDMLVRSADGVESLARNLEITPGPGNISSRDPSNIAGLIIAGQKVKFHNLTPVAGEPRLRAEYLPLERDQPLSPRSALESPRQRQPAAASHWPDFRSTAARTVEDSERDVESGSDNELGSNVSAPSMETIQSERETTPTRTRPAPVMRPGNRRVLLRPSTVRPIPSTRPSSGWRASLPGASDIDWKALRKLIKGDASPVARGLSDAELYDVIIGRKKVRRSPDLGEYLRSILSD